MTISSLIIIRIIQNSNNLNFSDSEGHSPMIFAPPFRTDLSGRPLRRRKARTVFSDDQLQGLERKFKVIEGSIKPQESSYHNP